MQHKNRMTNQCNTAKVLAQYKELDCYDSTTNEALYSWATQVYKTQNFSFHIESQHTECTYYLTENDQNNEDFKIATDILVNAQLAKVHKNFLTTDKATITSLLINQLSHSNNEAREKILVNYLKNGWVYLVIEALKQMKSSHIIHCYNLLKKDYTLVAVNSIHVLPTSKREEEFKYFYKKLVCAKTAYKNTQLIADLASQLYSAIPANESNLPLFKQWINDKTTVSIPALFCYYEVSKDLDFFLEKIDAFEDQVQGIYIHNKVSVKHDHFFYVSIIFHAAKNAYRYDFQSPPSNQGGFNYFQYLLKDCEIALLKAIFDHYYSENEEVRNAGKELFAWLLNHCNTDALEEAGLKFILNTCFRYGTIAVVSLLRYIERVPKTGLYKSYCLKPLDKGVLLTLIFYMREPYNAGITANILKLLPPHTTQCVLDQFGGLRYLGLRGIKLLLLRYGINHQTFFISLKDFYETEKETFDFDDTNLLENIKIDWRTEKDFLLSIIKNESHFGEALLYAHILNRSKDEKLLTKITLLDVLEIIKKTERDSYANVIADIFYHDSLNRKEELLNLLNNKETSKTQFKQLLYWFGVFLKNVQSHHFSDSFHINFVNLIDDKGNQRHTDFLLRFVNEEWVSRWLTPCLSPDNVSDPNFRLHIKNLYNKVMQHQENLNISAIKLTLNQ